MYQYIYIYIPSASKALLGGYLENSHLKLITSIKSERPSKVSTPYIPISLGNHLKSFSQV